MEKLEHTPMSDTEKIKAYDNRGFYYEVDIAHKPHFGFSNASYEGRIIAQVELYKLHQPHSDDDKEWEYYEERFAEWRDEIMVNMNPQITEYLSRQHER